MRLQEVFFHLQLPRCQDYFALTTTFFLTSELDQFSHFEFPIRPIILLYALCKIA